MLAAFLCWAPVPRDLEMEFLHPDQICYLGPKNWLHDIPNPAKMPLPMLPQGPQPYIPLHRPGSLNQELPSLPHHTKGSRTSASGFLGFAPPWVCQRH